MGCQLIINTFPYCCVDYLASIFAFVPPPDPLLYLQHTMSHLFSSIPLIYPHYLYVGLEFKTLQDLSLFPALRSCHISLPYPYASVTLCLVFPMHSGQHSLPLLWNLSWLECTLLDPINSYQFWDSLLFPPMVYFLFIITPFCKYIFISLAIEMA